MLFSLLVWLPFVFQHIRIGFHVWLPLKQEQVIDVVDVGAHSDFVSCVVIVQGLAVAADHHVGYLLLLVEFPAIIVLHQLPGVKGIL